MAFPETRLTVIQRIASTGSEADWRQFMDDYWGPVCRFAAQRGGLSLADAEDVASLTFEALVSGQLMSRWLVNRSAKLRTLLCAVTRNVLSNRARVGQGRARLLREHLEQCGEVSGTDAPVEQVDQFYAAWVSDLIEQAVEILLAEYHRGAKGDYFRVLYSRLCEKMTTNEIAEALNIKVTSAENYFKAARKRLREILQDLVKQHVGRYTTDTDAEEYELEWNRLGDYLTAHGGLEEAVSRAYEGVDVTPRRERKTEQISRALSRIRVTENT
jgi:RNA polymerase sigma factor (sigma-70 family)